jgi:hypothetical protein
VRKAHRRCAAAAPIAARVVPHCGRTLVTGSTASNEQFFRLAIRPGLTNQNHRVPNWFRASRCHKIQDASEVRSSIVGGNRDQAAAWCSLRASILPGKTGSHILAKML